MKKLFSVLIAIIMMMSAMTIFAGAAEASVNPSDILGQSTYYAKLIEGFDKADSADRTSFVSSRCTGEIADNVGVKGKAAKATGDTNTCEIWINLDANYDSTLYDGIMYWVDMTGVSYNADKLAQGQTGGVAARIYSTYHVGEQYAWTRNTVEPKVEGHEIKTYYYQNNEWKMSDNTSMSGERPNFPVNFKGWVYIPFTSYTTNKGADGNPCAGIWGGESISTIGILTGPYTDYKNTTIVLDEIQFVKLGVSEEPKPAETETPETDPLDTTPTTTQTEPQATSPAEQTTAAPTEQATEPAKKSGCGSSITTASMAVVLTPALGTACALKRRKRK